MKLLIIGDIVGKSGRRATQKAIEILKKDHDFDLIVANGENMAHGSGMTKKTFQEMCNAGIDFFTSGNHILKKNDIFSELEKEKPLIIRPANFAPGNEGIGYRLLQVKDKKILIINLIARVFMGRHYDCPFREADRLLENFSDEADFVLVDFHGEATSEKIAMKHYLNGRVAALWGTHTHVPTADFEVTEKGMAYITDIGMVGAKDSILGAEKEPILNSFLTQKSFALNPAEGRCVFNAIMLNLISNGVSDDIDLIQMEID